MTDKLIDQDPPIAALIAQWRGVEAEEARRRGYQETANTLESCANELEAIEAALRAVPPQQEMEIARQLREHADMLERSDVYGSAALHVAHGDCADLMRKAADLVEAASALRAVPHQQEPSTTNTREWKQRDIKLLRSTLSMLCHYVWFKQLREGEHMWSIPVDKERDFDCILSDAISELSALRAVRSPQDRRGQPAFAVCRCGHWETMHDETGRCRACPNPEHRYAFYEFLYELRGWEEAPEPRDGQLPSSGPGRSTSCDVTDEIRCPVASSPTTGAVRSEPFDERIGVILRQLRTDYENGALIGVLDCLEPLEAALGAVRSPQRQEMQDHVARGGNQAAGHVSSPPQEPTGDSSSLSSGSDHECLDWNSGGACYICRRPLSIEEQTPEEKQ